MTKSLLFLFGILAALVLAVLLHAVVSYHSDSDQMLQRLVSVTGIVSPSLSVSWYEPRLLFMQDAHHPAYPGMQSIDRMDLVYAR
ncbi:MAG: hypothetical protein L3J47_01065 [Sulfurovum sp.]|nr:hypothetical protein [Sulfurovum sp.]